MKLLLWIGCADAYVALGGQGHSCIVISGCKLYSASPRVGKGVAIGSNPQKVGKFIVFRAIYLYVATTAGCAGEHQLRKASVGCISYNKCRITIPCAADYKFAGRVRSADADVAVGCERN